MVVEVLVAMAGCVWHIRSDVVCEIMLGAMGIKGSVMMGGGDM